MASPAGDQKAHQVAVDDPRDLLRGPHALDESRDPLTLIAAKTTVFAYSTTFDDLGLGGKHPRKIGSLDFGAYRLWVRCLATDLSPPIPRRPFTKFCSE